MRRFTRVSRTARRATPRASASWSSTLGAEAYEWRFRPRSGRSRTPAPPAATETASAARDALELVEERLAAGLDDPRLAGALALECRPDTVCDRLGRQQLEAARLEVLLELGRRERRVGPAGTDRLDPDPARRELRRDRADEADDGVLRQPVDRIVGNPHEAGERRGHDDRAPLRHDAVETANAVDDAVDVHADRAAVLLVGERGDVVAPGQHARVETREVDRADVLPRLGIGHVEAGDEVELLHVEALGTELRHDRAADSTRRSGYQRCHGISTTFPVDWRDSMRRCASAASSSGSSAPTIGRTAPPSQSRRTSLDARATSSGSRPMRRPR